MDPLARPCRAFQLDVGYAVTPCVPGWMLPVDWPNDAPFPLPDLPRLRATC